MTRNWGRWGSEDERGAINLLTPERVRSAATAVERGEVIALAQPFSASSPASSGRSGLLHHMVRDGGDYAAGARVLGRSRFAEDFVGFSTHLGTHIDSLSHLWYDEELYNGHPQNSVRSGGARRCGVEKLGPVVGRGLLLDVAAHLGLEVLPGGTVIDAAMLRACCAGARVELEPADVVLLRTGWYANAGSGYFDGEPGLGLDGSEWLADRDVAAVGADNYAIEALTPGANDDGFPVHELLLRDAGVPLIENLDLEQLADRQPGPFLFVATPLPIVGATASPLAPIAVL